MATISQSRGSAWGRLASVTQATTTKPAPHRPSMKLTSPSTTLISQATSITPAMTAAFSARRAIACSIMTCLPNAV